MLRLSHAPTTPTLGSNGRGSTVALRLAQSVAMLPWVPERAGASAARGGHPLFTRLWPSVPFSHEVLWQDTFVALD